jgi:phosphonoacetaldehyde hydrolase
MGKAKRDHILAVTRMTEIAQQWREKYGHPCLEEDIDSMYHEFLPLQKETLRDHTDLIPGVAEAIQECRDMGLRIGSSTGYTRELMEVVVPATRAQGYEPDCVLCSEDAPRGRPAPYLLFEAAKRLDVYPMWSMVKVDDTPVGIEAGRNAGCWTVGITRTGNGVGLSLAEVDSLSPEELTARCDRAGETLRAAGAHYLLESVADLPLQLIEIDRRSVDGERPF